MDEVTHYLQQQGIEVQPAYFGESQFEYGKTLETEQWRLIYRVDDHIMTVCEMSSKTEPEGIGGALLELIRQLKKFKKEVNSLKQVRGRVFKDFGTPQEREQHQMLEQLLLKQGARIQDDVEGPWLVY
ncbi:secretion protein [Parashewanella curva]|uniref:Secretion protein n=1 Tax=Parashewanella curva TaxID=2338552 RepID=A0A3L8PZK8_9GAMM|nr:secretion protein [Parashewanella curva]RLV59968.1 secretion protein [Parashewanella curva]